MISEVSSNLGIHFKRCVHELFPYAQSLSIQGNVTIEIDKSLQIPVSFSESPEIPPSSNKFLSPLRTPLSSEPRSKRKLNHPIRYSPSDVTIKTDSDSNIDDNELMMDENGALNLSVKDSGDHLIPSDFAYNQIHLNPSPVFSPYFFNLPFSNESTNLLAPCFLPPKFKSHDVNDCLVPSPTTTKGNNLGKTSAKRKSSSGNRRSNLNRIFTCNQCKERFSTLSLLGQHTTSVHTFYRCVICQAQFTQRSNLQRHALKHVGFKPFLCRLCDKAYYRKDHLMRHLEMSHPLADPQTSIHVKLTYSECLDYLEQRPITQPENDNDLDTIKKSNSDEAAPTLVANEEKL